MSQEHIYKAAINWTGNIGTGTSAYTAYSRDHEISGDNKEVILGSAAAIYRGDSSRYNPEELLIASISGCHMLWYLHLCADAGVIVVDYRDEASGRLEVYADDNGKMVEVTIKPRVTISASSDAKTAESLHQKAHEFCFIANSMNFPVKFEPEIIVEKQLAAEK